MITISTTRPISRGLGGVTVMCCWEGVVCEECVTRKYSCSNKAGRGELVSGIPRWLHGQGAEKSSVLLVWRMCTNNPLEWVTISLPKPLAGNSLKAQMQTVLVPPWGGRLLCWVCLGVCFSFWGRWRWDKWYLCYPHMFLSSTSVGFEEQRETRSDPWPSLFWPIMATKNAKPIFHAIKHYTSYFISFNK